MATIHPVILSGGSGQRLWPLSRALYPKQLLPLHSRASMLQETALRVAGDPFAAPTVVCNEVHRFIVAEQLRVLDLAPAAIVLEPAGRNTAAAAAVAALSLAESDARALMLVLPSDHVIIDGGRFREAVATAVAAARDGALVTFGIPPESPETGYGYIRRGDPWDGAEGCFRVSRFVEKPDRGTAEHYVESGEYDWNSGIFLFAAGRFLDELARFHPAIVDACRRALTGGSRDLDFFRLDAPAFEACPSLSIDYAVMEHTADAAVVPVDMGWSDVGSWSALWDIGDKDGGGNVLEGDVLAKGIRNCYIRSDGLLVAAVGVEDVVVVATDDAVLVSTREDAQEVKAVVETLKNRGRQEYLFHSTVYRPWGNY